MKTNKFQIYLAGKMGGLTYEEMMGWRLLATKKLHIFSELLNTPINVINPVNYYNFENIHHQSEREVMDFDLARVAESDLVIANLCEVNTSIGTCIEIYEAHKRGIPVIGINCDKNNEIHPWVLCCTNRIEKNLQDTCEYISNFYFQ